MKKVKGEVNLANGVDNAEATLAGAALAARRWQRKSGHYRVLRHIWHTADERYYGPGETVDLSHLSNDALAILLEDGIIEPIAEEEKDGILSEEHQD